MKKSIILSVFFLSIYFGAIAQIEIDRTKGSTLLPQEEMTLVYGVDYYGVEYDFNLKIITNEENEVVFDYNMTNSSKTKGTVKMTKNALQNATAQYNYFQGGKVDLDDMTSVWISKKVYNELTSKKGMSVISPDGGKTSIDVYAIKAGYDYSVYNAISKRTFNDVGYIYAESKDKKTKYWISYSEYLPFILKMDLGWKIWLKEMRRD